MAVYRTEGGDLGPCRARLAKCAVSAEAGITALCGPMRRTLSGGKIG
jgi:hypothetical protein